MKKFKAVIMISALISGLLAGCGQSNAEYLKDIKEEKIVTIGEYKGIEIAMTKTEVADEDVDLILDEFRAGTPMPVEITGAAKIGDQVNFDYEGKVDGVAFDGGTDTDMTLVLGEGQFIEDLEQGMVGITAGEVVDVPVTFPEDYHSADLAGKEAVFTITMHSVSEMQIVPELTDASIEYITGGQYTDLAEYKALLKTELTQQLADNKDNLISQTVIENSEFKTIPTAYADRLKTLMTTNITAEATNNGMDLNTYLTYNGMLGEGQTGDDFIAGQVELVAKQYLTYQVIADAEGLNVTDSEVDADISTRAAEVGVTAEEYIASVELDKEAYREMMMAEKVAAFLAENAVVKLEEATPDAAEATPDADETTAAEAP